MRAESFQLCLTLCSPVDCIWLLCPWDFSVKNTAVGYCALLQGIFLIQALNQHLLRLLHWQAASLALAPSRKAKHKLDLKPLHDLYFIHSTNISIECLLGGRQCPIPALMELTV